MMVPFRQVYQKTNSVAWFLLAVFQPQEGIAGWFPEDLPQGRPHVARWRWSRLAGSLPTSRGGEYALRTQDVVP